MKNLLNKKISERLMAAYKQSGLTQKEIAEKINVTQQMISSYLCGKNMPALDTFANLCVILDVDPAYILGIED